nr:hypothetical protein [Ornithinimicrobium kibberense]
MTRFQRDRPAAVADGESVLSKRGRDAVELVPVYACARQLDHDSVIAMPWNNVHVDVRNILLGLCPIGQVQIHRWCVLSLDSPRHQLRHAPQGGPLNRAEVIQRGDMSARHDEHVPGATGYASMKATVSSSLAATLASPRSLAISQNEHAAAALPDMDALYEHPSMVAESAAYACA